MKRKSIKVYIKEFMELSAYNNVLRSNPHAIRLLEKSRENEPAPPVPPMFGESRWKAFIRLWWSTPSLAEMPASMAMESMSRNPS